MTRPIYTRTVIENLEWLEHAIANGATFFVGHSGGKDSQALAAVIESLVPASQIVYVHADLGNVEWSGIKDHIRGCLPAGKTLQVVNAQYRDATPKLLVERIERRYSQLVVQGKADTASPWPDRASRYCTGELKVDPIWKLIRNWPGCTQPAGYSKMRQRPIVINCVGIRAQESTRRAKLNPLTVNKKQDNGRREAWDFYPIFDLSIDDVWAIITASGQTRHPAYEAGNDRLSCLFCVFGSANDWRNGAKVNPALYRKFVEMEKTFGKTIRRNQSIEQWVGITVSEESDHG